MTTRIHPRALRPLTGAAALLFLTTVLPVHAQAPAGQRRGARGNNGNNANPGANGAPGAPGFNFGAMMNTPMGAQLGDMLTKTRQLRAFVDPGISQTSNLLTRPDVRNELVLNGRQTEALSNMQNGYPAAMMQSVMTTVMGSIQKMQAEGNMDFRSMTPDDRQQLFTQIRDKATEGVFAFQGEQNKQAEALLTPAQTKRLNELDLQWRGPLALSDEKLADKVALTPEQRAKFTAMVKELRDARMKAQMSMFSPGGGFPGFGGAPGANPAAKTPNGANGGAGTGVKKPAPPAPPKDANGTDTQTGKSGATAPPATPDPNAAPARPGFAPPSQEQIQRMMDESAKQGEILLKATEKKAILLLTPEQQTQWKLLQGKPFTFRQNL